MDAIKMDENKKVVLKHIIDTEEFLILRRLLSVKDERNHTCPLIDTVLVWSDETGSDEMYLVMPFLRRAFDLPYFGRLGEVLTAVHQFLLGLEFMHAQDVAHRDACYGNLMVDANQFLPEHHFSAPHTRDGVNPIRPFPRFSVPNIRYYFIDFGLSVWCPTPSGRFALGCVGQDRTVPEWQQDLLIYDPFKLDIYQLGNTILRELLNIYTGLEVLRALVTSMTQVDPSQRPTATEAREYFESLTVQCDGRHFVYVTKTTFMIERVIFSAKNWLMSRRRERAWEG
ncbi:kinase-like domain-containing protein [Mycena belliarum]|uniref:Kinase-like domain-containing protein n=1 Tax=Mycena belliarum TaxID=1033014 RepID=A0AAD6TUG9_9AGAR|nr:kinase-like domain-containing protein [Mycena belliae]